MLPLPEATITRFIIHTALSSKPVSEEEYAGIHDWLCGSPYYSHHEFVSQSRLPGVGKWLLSHPEYIDWYNTSSSSLLLLHGIPGSGKTTLCSVVVDAFLTTAANNPLAAPLGYFYCTNLKSEKARSSSDDIMRTILGQLAMGSIESRTTRDFLCSEYARQSAQARVDGLDLPKLKTGDCKRLILELAEKDPLTIVIDSLDSLDEEERTRLLGALNDIVAKSESVVKIFTTSRSNSHATSSADKQIRITAHETHEDMEAYVRHHVSTSAIDRVLLEGDVFPSLQRTLVQTLLDAAGEK